MTHICICGIGYQVFRQQSESAKIALQQRRHAGKVKAKEGVIASQLEAEEQAHQRAVAARKVLIASHTFLFEAHWSHSSRNNKALMYLLMPCQELHIQKSIACQSVPCTFTSFKATDIWHRMVVCFVLSPEKLSMQQAVQQVEAQFAKEMGAEAREKRIDR